MTFPQRKNSLRLEGYDYTSDGAYFVTIACYKRLHLFGEIEDNTMTLSKLGGIVDQCWLEIPTHFSNVCLDKYVIMPNHIHGILFFNHEANGTTLGQVINLFKGAVTRIARNTTLDNDLDYPIWQRNFHDHIIRDQNDYDRIAEYVHYNPSRWAEDSLND